MGIASSGQGSRQQWPLTEPPICQQSPASLIPNQSRGHLWSGSLLSLYKEIKEGISIQKSVSQTRFLSKVLLAHYWLSVSPGSCPFALVPQCHCLGSQDQGQRDPCLQTAAFSELWHWVSHPHPWQAGSSPGWGWGLKPEPLGSVRVCSWVCRTGLGGNSFLFVPISLTSYKKQVKAIYANPFSIVWDILPFDNRQTGRGKSHRQASFEDPI